MLPLRPLPAFKRAMAAAAPWHEFVSAGPAAAKNWLVAGRPPLANAAAIYSSIETARRLASIPRPISRNVPERVADHPVSRVAELLPWNIHVSALQAALIQPPHLKPDGYEHRPATARK